MRQPRSNLNGPSNFVHFLYLCHPSISLEERATTCSLHALQSQYLLKLPKVHEYRHFRVCKTINNKIDDSAQKSLWECVYTFSTKLNCKIEYPVQITAFQIFAKTSKFHHILNILVPFGRIPKKNDNILWENGKLYDKQNS